MPHVYLIKPTFRTNVACIVEPHCIDLFIILAILCKVRHLPIVYIRLTYTLSKFVSNSGKSVYISYVLCITQSLITSQKLCKNVQN